ncbi:MAG TPA: GLUG motif-containing protein [Clostridia bacterium]|nr:GLUG motif-containing protein [Clostridia bacterium]
MHMRKFSTILAVIIILSTLIPDVIGASPEPAYRIISIDDAKDLRKLSEDCSYDAFSRGIKVILNADIDLKDEDFIPIPIFAGIFDGGGHTIKGLSVAVEGSNQGLFRYLEEDATIRDLKVQGAVTPTGEKSTIGGLVGYNQGTIENCEFSGYIKGKDIVGGLAGWNGSTGMITDSWTKGAVYGRRKVGGIAGYNTGTILSCTNESSVNTTIEEYKVDLGEIDIENLDMAELSKLSSDITDIGGISGINTGTIKNTQNHGTVGYPQVGYNIGGIAGRQTGYISGCLNQGIVQGRKEIGGIVGQMEPYIDVLIPPSKLNKLHEELNTLHSSINKMISFTQTTSADMNQKLSKIQDGINAGKAHAQELISMSEDLIDKTGTAGEEILGRIKPIIEGLNDIPKDLENAISTMEESMDYIRRILEKIEEYDWDDERLTLKAEHLLSIAKDVRDGLGRAGADIDQVLKKLQTGETEGIPELLQSVSESLNSVMDVVSEGLEDIREIGEIIGELIVSLDGDISEDLKAALDYMDRAFDLLGDVFNKIQDISKQINDLIGYFTDMPQLDFEAIRDVYEKTKEDLFDSMGDMSVTLSDLMDSMFVQGKIMIGDMQGINDQLFLVMDLSFSLIDDLMNEEKGLDNVYQDVSREDIDKKTDGKVFRSKNLGTIEGDINVGGIAGAMAIELKFDPEDDFNIIKNTPINSVFQTSAIIQQCENGGGVVGKKNNVGGIVGSMDLGYILDGVAADLVESTDGDYVGGIAGKAHGPIVNSYAKSTLRGANYIGGIAGYGTEILDSHTLIRIERSNACVGAIAGDVDKNNVIKANSFVSKTLSGIDGISYIERAEPISYRELISKENLPSIFKEFRLAFVAEDEIIRTQNLNYGDSVSKIDLPDVPEKDGYHGEWEEFDGEDITFDTTIKAIYTPIATVLESDEKWDNVLPMVLVEGQFAYDDTLTLGFDDEAELPEFKKGAEADQLTVIIPDDGESKHIIRYLPSVAGREMDLYILSSGNWSRSKSHTDGKYLVFEAEGNTVTFAVVYNKLPYKGLIVLVAVISIVVVLTIYVKNRKRHPKSIGLG